MIAALCGSRELSAVTRVGSAMLISLFSACAAAEDLSGAVHAYLQRCVDARNGDIGIVVGIVDEQESKVIAYGQLGSQTGRTVDGDTLFEIGSDTKTFTALLLQDMVERKQMQLDDPVAMYLPAAVKVPARNGKQITLRHLATHISGLPNVPDNLGAKRADNPYADYSVESMYAFLSDHQLTRDPGEKSEYSNLGMGLLGHVIALEAAASYESLVLDRICRPLKMHSTRITLTSELKSRFATGHNQFGEPVPSWDIPVLAGAGGLRSTANDLLKYLSAQLALTSSDLTPLMEKTHDQRLAWFVTTDQEGTTVFSHGGGTGGCSTFTAFDKTQRRGVVVLTNSKGVVDVEAFGRFLLQCDWQSHHRPTASNISGKAADAYVGRYRRVPAFASRVATLGPFAFTVAQAAACSVAACCFAVLGVAGWRIPRFRRPAVIFGCAVLATGVTAACIMRLSRQTVDAAPEAEIIIRREADRLFAGATGSGSWPINALLPPGDGELLSESNAQFFERLSGNRFAFSQDTQGKPTRLTASYRGDAIVYEQCSQRPPDATEPPQPRVAITLDTERLDAFVGEYAFTPSVVYPAGIQVRVWREDNQLLWQEHGKNAVDGAMEIYPETQTRFFTKIDAARLTFNKNRDGEVTAVSLQIAGSAVLTGTKVAND